MRADDPEQVAKVQCVNALFADATFHDPFLNDSMCAAIEAAISGEDGPPAPLTEFLAKALELRAQRGGAPVGFDLRHLNLRGKSYDPLFVRQELLLHLKHLAGYPRSLLVISALRDAVSTGNPRSRKNTQRFEEARRYIEALTSQYAGPGCCTTILYVN